ncbi:hypothetical protein ACHAW6_008200 [Cyclotella cf. meneghiniana]
MKKQNAVSKRRPRQNILSIILGSAKQRSNGSNATSNTAPTSKSSLSRTHPSTPRKSNKLIQTAVELTRRSKTSSRKQSSKNGATFLKGSRAFYRGPKGIEKVTVVGVHHDAKLEPYYTIKFRDGKEKQMDGKCLTPIEEKKESGLVSSSRQHGGNEAKIKFSASSNELPTDQCSTSSSDREEAEQDNDHGEEEEEEDDRFHQGQDAYYRSPSGEHVTKIKIVEKIPPNRYCIALNDGTKKQVDQKNLAGLIDLSSKELASLMKEKNERNGGVSGGNGKHKDISNSERRNVEHGDSDLDCRRLESTGTSTLRSSLQSKGSLPTIDQGYEPEMDPSSSENSYENNIADSPNSNNTVEEVLALPCAVEMVEAKTEDGGTKIVPLYKAEMEVYYRGPQGITTALILSTHLDDLLEPYYTIRLPDGREKQTDNAHISLEEPVIEEDDEDQEGGDGEADDDWYQEWKRSQIGLKENEETLVENQAPSSEKPLSPEICPPAIEQRSTRPKDEKPEPDPSSGALVPKQRGPEYAGETPQDKKQDPVETASLVQVPQFHVGDDVLYNSSKGDHLRATIIKLRKDEKHRPYYVIKLSTGDEKKVYGHRLTAVSREERTATRRRSRSKSVTRREREPPEQISKRSASVDTRRMSRRPSIDSRASRDEPVDSMRCSQRSSDRASRAAERSRSVSRPPSELDRSRGRRGESRDPRGRVHPTDEKESRSRSKSIRAAPRDTTSKESSEHRPRERSRSRAPEDTIRRRPTVTRKGPMTPSVSHRVQHIGEDDSISKKSRSSSRFSKLKSSLTGSMSKAKQRSFERT